MDSESIPSMEELEKIANSYLEEPANEAHRDQVGDLDHFLTVLHGLIAAERWNDARILSSHLISDEFAGTWDAYPKAGLILASARSRFQMEVEDFGQGQYEEAARLYTQFNQDLNDEWSTGSGDALDEAGLQQREDALAKLGRIEDDLRAIHEMRAAGAVGRPLAEEDKVRPFARVMSCPETIMRVCSAML